MCHYCRWSEGEEGCLTPLLKRFHCLKTGRKFKLIISCKIYKYLYFKFCGAISGNIAWPYTHRLTIIHVPRHNLVTKLAICSLLQPQQKSGSATGRSTLWRSYRILRYSLGSQAYCICSLYTCTIFKQGKVDGRAKIFCRR